MKKVTNEKTLETLISYINYINKNIKRGDIVYVSTNSKETGHVQSGSRPYIIVSNDVCNKVSPVLTAVPLTTRSKKPIPTHVDIDGFGLLHKSTALCEQIISIDKCNIDKVIGQLDNETLEKIILAIKIQIGA